MSKPRHHRVPEQDLKRFTDDTGRFYYLRKDRDRWRIEYRNPESVMKTGWYYGLRLAKAGEDPGEPEIQLQQSEDRAARIINDLLAQVREWKSRIPKDCSSRQLERIASVARTNCPVTLSPAEGKILQEYVLERAMRTHSREERENSVREDLASEIARIFGKEELDKIDLHSIVRDGSTRSIAQGVTPFIRTVLSRMMLVVSVVISRSAAPFIIGDIGSLNCIPEGKTLSDQGSEYFMPLSSCTAVSITPGSGVQLNPVLDGRAVRKVNEGMFFKSREVACREEKVLKSLMRAYRKRALYLQRHSQQN